MSAMTPEQLRAMSVEEMQARIGRPFTSRERYEEALDLAAAWAAEHPGVPISTEVAIKFLMMEAWKFEPPDAPDVSALDPIKPGEIIESWVGTDLENA